MTKPISSIILLEKSLLKLISKQFIFLTYLKALIFLEFVETYTKIDIILLFLNGKISHLSCVRTAVTVVISLHFVHLSSQVFWGILLSLRQLEFCSWILQFISDISISIWSDSSHNWKTRNFAYATLNSLKNGLSHIFFCLFILLLVKLNNTYNTLINSAYIKIQHPWPSIINFLITVSKVAHTTFHSIFRRIFFVHTVASNWQRWCW